MSKINVAVECNIEHRASVYALLTSIVANKGVSSEYCIYALLGTSKKADWSDFSALAGEKVEIVFSEGLLGELRGIGKLIYLNWNTLVMGDLSELYNTDLDEKAFAAAENLPDKECVIPRGQDAHNTSVLLLDTDRLQDTTDFKRISVFYNYGFEEYVGNQEALPAKDYVGVRDWALILRADQENPPEKYFDGPLAQIWMKYYKASPIGSEPLKRIAWAETVGESERDIEKAVPVLLCVEDSTVPCVMIQIASLAENLPEGRALDIRLVYSQLSIEHKKMLMDMSSCRVKIVLYNTKKYTLKQSRTCKEILASLIYDEYDKAICLGTRVILEDDISKIFDLSMEDYLIRALPIAEAETSQTEQTDIYLRDITGMNTDISVINVKSWIENDINEQVQSLLNDGKYKKYDEQDVLNIVCLKKRAFIDEPIKIHVYEAALDETSEDEDVKEVLMQIQKLEANNKQLKEANQKLKAENKQLGKEKDRYLYEITEIRKSMTYKIGRALTLIPRKLRGDK